jgi:hypothetical protein
MKVFSPFLNGNTTTSGSFNVPNHPGTGSIPNPLTGSLFHDDTEGILKIYTGTQWQVVGEQETPFIPDYTVEYLVVAGGGGGSYDRGGGGGAGGLLSSSYSNVPEGTIFTATIGGGGTGTQSTDVGSNGTNTVLESTGHSTVTAIGGGKANYRANGSSGGSGGGASFNYSSNTFSGGTGTVGQGNDGGNSTSGDNNRTAGGGGGAGQAGQTPNGGNGLQTNITGVATYFAGGGGGGDATSDRSGGGPGTGGLGGGGNGGDYSPATPPENGIANTGGGGGGDDTNSPNIGANGGSGVIVLRIPTYHYSGTYTGTPSATTSGTDTILIFSGSGTYTA